MALVFWLPSHAASTEHVNVPVSAPLSVTVHAPPELVPVLDDIVPVLVDAVPAPPMPVPVDALPVDAVPVDAVPVDAVPVVPVLVASVPLPPPGPEVDVELPHAQSAHAIAASAIRFLIDVICKDLPRIPRRADQPTPGRPPLSRPARVALPARELAPPGRLRAISVPVHPRAIALLLALAALPGCFLWGETGGPMHVSLQDVAKGGDALAISDALEELIAQGKDTPADRDFALNAIKEHPQHTAAYAFARAAVTGRVVERRGLLGAGMAADVEHWALESKRLDPNFRNGAATRMLGTLYVMAPAGWLEHGDSEQGLEMLEGLVKAHPETIENHVRLAEAYITLGDPAPATPYLCKAVAHRAELRLDEQHLVDRLYGDAGRPHCADAPAPPPVPPKQSGCLCAAAGGDAPSEAGAGAIALVVVAVARRRRRAGSARRGT